MKILFIICGLLSSNLYANSILIDSVVEFKDGIDPALSANTVAHSLVTAKLKVINSFTGAPNDKELVGFSVYSGNSCSSTVKVNGVNTVVENQTTKIGEINLNGYDRDGNEVFYEYGCDLSGYDNGNPLYVCKIENAFLDAFVPNYNGPTHAANASLNHLNFPLLVSGTKNYNLAFAPIYGTVLPQPLVRTTNFTNCKTKGFSLKEAASMATVNGRLSLVFPQVKAKFAHNEAGIKIQSIQRLKADAEQVQPQVVYQYGEVRPYNSLTTVTGAQGGVPLTGLVNLAKNARYEVSVYCAYGYTQKFQFVASNSYENFDVSRIESLLPGCTNNVTPL